MKRFILTGAPGAGKTAILQALAARGWPVVAEAATDVIARAQADGRDEPWREPRFIDDILALQEKRELAALEAGGGTVIFDRSPICTLALARHLGGPVSTALAGALGRIARDRTYEPRVFFVESLGFIVNTEARRIGLDEAQKFGALHEAAYRELGYELVRIAPGPVEQRAEAVLAWLPQPR